MQFKKIDFILIMSLLKETHSNQNLQIIILIFSNLICIHNFLAAIKYR